MDKKNDHIIPHCGEKPELAGETFVVGAKQLKKAVLSGSAKCAYLAENADPAVLEPLKALCGEAGVSIHWAGSMSELGRSCGIDVGAAAAAVLRQRDSTGDLP